MPKKSPAPPTDAVAQREALWSKLAKADERAVAADARHVEVQNALNDAHRALANTRIAEVTGDATAEDVTERRNEVNRLEAELRLAEEDFRPIQLVTGDLTRQVQRLHRTRTDEFADAAEPLIEDARAKLEAVLPSLREAYSAWQAAASFWGPVARDAELGRVPAWPLMTPAEASQVLRTMAPAPDEYSPTSRAEPVEPGTPKLYRRSDGTVIECREDDEMDRICRTDRDFAVIAIGLDEVRAALAVEREHTAPGSTVVTGLTTPAPGAVAGARDSTY